MLYIEKVEQQQNGLGAWFGFHQSGKLEVELPAGVALDISNDNGAVQVDGGDAGTSFPTVTIARTTTPSNCAAHRSEPSPAERQRQRDRGKCDRRDVERRDG